MVLVVLEIMLQAMWTRPRTQGKLLNFVDLTAYKIVHRRFVTFSKDPVSF